MEEVNAVKQGKKPFRPAYKWAIRLLAALLVVALLATGVLYDAVNIKISSDNAENYAIMLAAQQLMNNDAYVQQSRLGRMTDYMRNFLSVADSFDDYEMGASIAISQGDYRGAIACTEESLNLFRGGDEQRAELVMRIGYLYTLLEEYETALTWLSDGMEMAEPTAEAYLTRAQIYLNLDKVTLALADVSQYIDRSDNPLELIPSVVNVYEAAGDYETASRYYTRLLDDPEHYSAEYLISRAYCYTQMGDMESAKADCAVYDGLEDAQRGTANVILGVGWMAAADYSAAREAFLAAADGGFVPGESLYYHIMLCSYLMADYQTAAQYGELAIAWFTSDAGEGDPEESAVKVYNISIGDVDLAMLYLMTGMAHFERGEYENAIQCMDGSLSQNPYMENAYYLRGVSQLQLGNYGKGAADLTESIARGEEVESSHYSRGLCRYKMGSFVAAQDDFDWVLLNGSNEELFSAAMSMMGLISGGGEEPAETAAPDK